MKHPPSCGTFRAAFATHWLKRGLYPGAQARSDGRHQPSRRHAAAPSGGYRVREPLLVVDTIDQKLVPQPGLTSLEENSSRKTSGAARWLSETIQFVLD
jgi:hypothetical protein